jgi:phenylalanyl-tRNA synthetase beta chain
MFSEYCSNPFEVEAAEVVDPDGKTVLYPALNYRTEKISKTKVNKLIGKFGGFC